MSVRLGERRPVAAGGSPVVTLWLRSIGARIEAHVALIALGQRDPAARIMCGAVRPEPDGGQVRLVR